MPSPTDFNLSPYYDDYNESKKFHRILFRPSFAVQARELTQSQTILQNQIERFGDHMFKQGAMIIPGQMAFDLEYSSIKLTSKSVSMLNSFDAFILSLGWSKGSRVLLSCKCFIISFIVSNNLITLNMHNLIL